LVFNEKSFIIKDMYTIILQLTKGFLKILGDKGYDLTQLVPKSEIEIQFEVDRAELINQQGLISLKRAEIIDVQQELLKITEPFLFNSLNQSKDNWEINIGTKNWFDSIRSIKKNIEQHEKMIVDFDKKYNEFTEKYNL
jgi:hypothetical protein